MDKIVYILGAGFSSPLSLPVMSNFIEMSKNLYASDKDKYKHFNKVFDSIRKRLVYVTLYHNTENLKKIDVICRDEGNVVKDRYDAFISLVYPKLDFIHLQKAQPADSPRKTALL